MEIVLQNLYLIYVSQQTNVHLIRSRSTLCCAICLVFSSRVIYFSLFSLLVDLCPHLIRFASIHCASCFIIWKNEMWNEDRLNKFGAPSFNRVIGTMSFILHSTQPLGWMGCLPTGLQNNPKQRSAFNYLEGLPLSNKVIFINTLFNTVVKIKFKKYRVKILLMHSLCVR